MLFGKKRLLLFDVYMEIILVCNSKNQKILIILQEVCQGTKVKDTFRHN